MALSSVAVTAGIMSTISGILILLISSLIFKRLLERKQHSTLFLGLSTTCFAIASFACTIIYFMAEKDLNLAIFCQKLVYASIFTACILTFLFAHYIFFEKAKKKWIYIYLIIGIIVTIVLFATDSVVIETFPDGSGYPLLTIAFGFSLVVVLYLFPTIIGIFVTAMVVSRKVEERVYKFGFRLIAGGQLMILCTFVVDTLASLFMDQIMLYTLFLVLTWVFPLFAAIMYYLGWCMPDWFKNKLTAK